MRTHLVSIIAAAAALLIPAVGSAQPTVEERLSVAETQIAALAVLVTDVRAENDDLQLQVNRLRLAVDVLEARLGCLSSRPVTWALLGGRRVLAAGPGGLRVPVFNVACLWAFPLTR